MPHLSTRQTPALPGAPAGWAAALRRRMRYRLWLKFLGVSAFMWVFFIGYFHTLRHPLHAVSLMPLTPLDAWIPFQPALLWPYVSLWLYVGIAPGLMLDIRALLVHGAWAAGLCAAGLVCFALWPTAVPLPPPVDLQLYPAFALLQGVDAAGNACPSLHVAAAMFSGCWIRRQLQDIAAPAALQLLNVAWFVAIAYSTLAIKQHVVIDVIGGAALGAAFAFASLRQRPRN